jgi:pyruvate/2-oxoglutarate dehydrogenase complex dihydrolipoamide acyltransferase (E2) component
MRAGACTILGIGAILIAAPVWAAGGRYDPDYPVCMEAIDEGGTRIDCMYTSIEQCRLATFGSSGNCFSNPSYVPRPAEVAPAQTEPAPAAKPGKSAGRYDPSYPVCMEAYGADGSRIECFFTSMEQCKLGTTGTGGTCFNNPYYVPPPAAAAPQAEPAPPAKPAKRAKSAKSAKSPPSPQPARLQQR